MSATHTPAAVPPDHSRPAPCELWVPEQGDQMFSLLIGQGGGAPLFAMDEAEACAELMSWWRHHRDRYRRNEAACRRRALLALVPGHVDPEPCEGNP